MKTPEKMSAPPPAMKQPTISTSPASPKKINGKISLFSHIKYEHMVAGVSGKNLEGN